MKGQFTCKACGVVFVSYGQRPNKTPQFCSRRCRGTINIPHLVKYVRERLSGGTLSEEHKAKLRKPKTITNEYRAMLVELGRRNAAKYLNKRKPTAEENAANSERSKRRPDIEKLKARILKVGYRPKKWKVRDPSGRVLVFVDAMKWARENEHLFPMVSGKTNKAKLIANGIRSLFDEEGVKKYVPSSWHGWTAFSITERRLNDGDDLLQRHNFG